MLIHPAKNFEAGHRYTVGMRKLRDGAGTKLEAPEGFRYLRDALPVKDPVVKAQRKRFDKVFRDLRKAKVKRRNLYLAWDFTVSSDENIAGRMLHIRDDAFAQLGDTDLADVQVQGGAPSFTVTSVENFTPAQDPELARRSRAPTRCPATWCPTASPAAASSSTGAAESQRHLQRRVQLRRPHAAVDAPGASPAARRSTGTGSWGRPQATSSDQQILGQTHNFVICATTIGFSSGDLSNIVTKIVPNLSNFPELTDRTQQGLLNTLFLGRLMIHANGFVSNAAFHTDGATLASPPVLDTSRLYYNGNSQGGILGAPRPRSLPTGPAPRWACRR